LSRFRQPWKGCWPSGRAQAMGNFKALFFPITIAVPAINNCAVEKKATKRLRIGGGDGKKELVVLFL